MPESTIETPEEVIVGTPKQIAGKVKDLHAKTLIVLPVPEANSAAAAAIGAALSDALPLLFESFQEGREETVRFLLQAIAARPPTTKRYFEEVAAVAKARKAVIEGATWLTAAEVSKLAGFSDTNPSAQPSKWKKHAQIFTVQFGNSELYPEYGLDPDANYRPVECMKRILATFERTKKDWGLAFWFASANSFLGGERPQDLIRRDPDRVVDAAADEMSGITHG